MAITKTNSRPDSAGTKKERRFFAHSNWDSLLLVVALLQFALFIAGIVTAGSIPWWGTAVLVLLGAFLTCTNYQCVAHNFIHNPFFPSKKLNQAFSVFNSLLIGGPHSLYRLHHLHHHKYNNDAPDPVTGTTKDMTSTWRYSPEPHREEVFWAYALLGYFRTGFGDLLGKAQQRKLTGLVAVETVIYAAGLLIALAVNPLGFCVFYLPVWLLGNILAQAENYLEHYGATPGNRMTDSVSCYNELYNLIWFNNGYHQEHHLRPQVHWTRIGEVKHLLPSEDQRRVVTGAHWFNFAKPNRPKPNENDLAPASTNRQRRKEGIVHNQSAPVAENSVLSAKSNCHS